jgi:hypothetical protein
MWWRRYGCLSNVLLAQSNGLASREEAGNGCLNRNVNSVISVTTHPCIRGKGSSKDEATHASPLHLTPMDSVVIARHPSAL